MMIVLTKADDLRAHISSARRNGEKIGFVPTMGALHEGHLSLIKDARRETGQTVCSIFVNPAQFNDPNDYKKYPVTISKDIQLLELSGTSVLFLPEVEEIYPTGHTGLEQYDLGFLESVLEGKYRPGHFQGVCQVMARLLRIVQPDDLFMGQKDYQQCMVVKKLLQLTGMDNTRFHVCATVREPDGLAMSSRNLRLNAQDRKTAATISVALRMVKEKLQPGDLSKLVEEAKSMLADKQFKTDYFEIADANSLEPVQHWDGSRHLVALVAAFLGEVRLIDNMVVS
ncbi:MAG: pantoate--beta-alanine ligase [Chitinophagaceae bacterium]